MSRQQLELLWQSVIVQSQNNGHGGFSFPLQQLSSFGNEGLQELLNRHSALTNTPAEARIFGQTVYVMSANPNPMPEGQRPLPEFGHNDSGSSAASPASTTSRARSVGDARSSQQRTKGKAKIPRPPNAFILYRQDNHPKLKLQYPQMHNNEISVRLGNQWKAEREEIKDYYKAKAEQAKQQHLENNPGYQYQPRKPSEKKRRMTKSKGALQMDANARRDSRSNSIYHTPTTGSTVSGESPITAATPSSQGSPSEQKYLDSVSQSYLGNIRQTAYTDHDVVPEFKDSEYGMANYDMSTFAYNQDLVGAMIDKFNSAKTPSPVFASSTLHNVKPSDLSHSERLQEDAIASILMDAVSRQGLDAAETPETTVVPGSARFDTGMASGTFDFEKFFDYDLLESDRNDSLEMEASLFQHEFLDTEPSLSTDTPT